MGILTRQLGTHFIISSDQDLDQKGTKRAPRFQSDVYRVWTGMDWSTNQSEALSFESLDDADEYVRANYSKVVS